MDKKEKNKISNGVKIIVAFVILLVFGLFDYGRAANEDFIMEISPENPGSNKEVIVDLNSYSFDIDRARITWRLNSIVQLTGIGEKNLSFKTGDIGEKTTLSITVVSEKGEQLTKSVVFIPADVDILWEAETYVPENYKGKALPSSESRIKVTAMPNFVSNGSKISSSKLIYRWEIRFKNIPSISGYGRQSFSYESSKIRNTDVIKVSVSDYNRNIIAEKSIYIDIGQPKIIFYKEHPLEGIQYNKALGNLYNLIENGIALVAEPYFFSKDRINNLTYKWKMNNNEIDFNEDGEKLNFTIDPENSSGVSIVEVDIRDNSNTLQFGKKEIQIKYNEED